MEGKEINKTTKSELQIKKDTVGVKRVAVYARVNSTHESQDELYETQRKYYEEKIAENSDMILVDVYSDYGVSGTQINNRPEFLRMMDDAETGKIDVIITESASRLSRNVIQLANTIKRLKELGVGIIFEQQEIDSANPESESFFNNLSSLVQEESNGI